MTWTQSALVKVLYGCFHVAIEGLYSLTAQTGCWWVWGGESYNIYFEKQYRVCEKRFPLYCRLYRPLYIHQVFTCFPFSSGVLCSEGMAHFSVQTIGIAFQYHHRLNCPPCTDRLRLCDMTHVETKLQTTKHRRSIGLWRLAGFIFLTMRCKFVHWEYLSGVCFWWVMGTRLILLIGSLIDSFYHRYQFMWGFFFNYYYFAMPFCPWLEFAQFPSMHILFAHFTCGTNAKWQDRRLWVCVLCFLKCKWFLCDCVWMQMGAVYSSDGISTGFVVT